MCRHGALLASFVWNVEWTMVELSTKVVPLCQLLWSLHILLIGLFCLSAIECNTIDARLRWPVILIGMKILLATRVYFQKVTYSQAAAICLMTNRMFPEYGIVSLHLTLLVPCLSDLRNSPQQTKQQPLLPVYPLAVRMMKD